MSSDSSGYADLHMHTTASDGSDSVEQRISQADDEDLRAIALTDHDAINNFLEHRVFKDEETGVQVITGAEIKCEIDGTGIEILGYFLDPGSETVGDVLETNSELRDERIREMVGNVDEIIDYDFSEEEVFDRVEGNPGRPHVAEALADAEEVTSVETIGDAFDKYIGEECPAYLPTPKLDAETVIEAVLDDGGVPVLAHPGRDLDEDEADSVVEKLSECGLKGLEVQYSWDHKIENDYGISFAEEKCRDLADEYGLIPTGGSDCHGSETDKYLIGSVKLDYSQVERLAEDAEAEVRL
mgnify:CR=1 FL=1